MKTGATIGSIQKIHLNIKDRHYLRVKGYKQIFQENRHNKQDGVNILIPDKMDFKPKLIRRDWKRHYIHIKGKIYQEDITVLNTYAPNPRAPKFIKETLLQLKSDIDPHVLIVGDFKYPILSNK